MPSRSRRARATINKYMRLWEQAEREARVWCKKYMEVTGCRLLLQADGTDNPIVLTRDDLVKALYVCGRSLECAGEACPLFRTGGSNCHNDLLLLAGCMLEHNLKGLTQERIEEALHHGNT